MEYRQKKSRKSRWRFVLLTGAAVALIVLVLSFLWRDTDKQQEKIGGGIGGVERESLPPAINDSGTLFPSHDSGQQRRSIYDRNLEILAKSIGVTSVYIRPLELRDRHVTVVKLADQLDLKEEKLFEDLRTERSFLWLKHDISLEKAQSIDGLDLEGVYRVTEGKRYYPFNSHASHLIGFAEKGHGLAGAEFLYDSLLRDENRRLTTPLMLIEQSESETLSGASLILTIDIDLQIFLEVKLELLLKTVGGTSGSAVIMDARTGELYALANLPAYNPNTFWKADNYSRKNRAVDEVFQLGAFRDLFRVAAEIYSGNIVEHEALVPNEIADRIIEPRRTKKVMGGSAISGSDWEKWGDDGFVYPQIHWPKEFTASSANNVDFCSKIGLANTRYLSDQSRQFQQEPKADSEKCDLTSADLPVTLVGLSAGFSQLLNGGVAHEPKIVHGVWRDEEKRTAGTDVGTVNEGIGAVTSANIRDFLTGLYPATNRGVVVVESFTPSPVNSNDSRQEVEIIEGTKRENVEAVDGSVPQIGRAVLLAGDASAERQLVLGLMIEGANAQMPSRSPFRPVAYDILRKGGRLLDKNAARQTSSPKDLSYAEAYRRWHRIVASQSDLAAKEVEKKAKSVMPNIRGLSLRKALQDINGLDLRLSIKGAGRVVRQSIAPGVKIKDDQVLILEMSIDN